MIPLMIIIVQNSKILNPISQDFTNKIDIFRLKLHAVKNDNINI